MRSGRIRGSGTRGIEPARVHIHTLAPPALQPCLQLAALARRSVSVSSMARTGEGTCARVRGKQCAHLVLKEHGEVRHEPRRIRASPVVHDCERGVPWYEQPALPDQAQTRLVERVKAAPCQRQRAVANRPASAPAQDVARHTHEKHQAAGPPRMCPRLRTGRWPSRGGAQARVRPAHLRQASK
jgi:hypothetical protein